MMKCVEHGHEIVAVANLHPPLAVGEELDSFMYQTVGHAHVPALAEALELPLFRREIAGTAVEQGVRYSRADGDEVEDLHELLSEVKASLPGGITAVCSGAILSSYQRMRVESVCERLGLVSFAFLWQREQAPLLDEMINAGIHAVLVKVASLGLTQHHLGKSLGELRGHFAKLEQRFGFHVCGEGGEYETFTLDCPLFKRRLEPVDASVHVQGGGAALISFKSVELHEKHAAVEGEANVDLSGNGDGDGDGAQGGSAFAWEEEAGDEARPAGEDALPLARCSGWSIVEDDARVAAPLVQVADVGAGLVHVAVYADPDSAGSDEAPAQLSDALARLESALGAHGDGDAPLGLGAVLLMRLYVADMGEYAAVNAAFSAKMARVAPAARVAIQLPLATAAPDGDVAVAAAGPGGGARRSTRKVAVECLAWAGGEKQLLHVQSISEWAPRMIGPYCQLTIGRGVGYVAGSLGLQPSSMTLVGGGAARQAALALHNCAQVLRGLSQTAAHAAALIVYVTRAEDAQVVAGVSQRWLRHVTSRPAAPADELPPLMVLQAGALPMAALVEAQLEVSSAADGAPTTRETLCFRVAGEGDSKGGGAEVDVRCDAVVLPHGTAPDTAAAAAGATACGHAFLLVCADAGASISARHVGRAISEATSRLEERLRNGEGGGSAAAAAAIGPSVYARIFYDGALGLEPARFASRVSEAFDAEARAAGALQRCTAFALPVEGVLSPGGRARVAVQLHFTSAARACGQVDD